MLFSEDNSTHRCRKSCFLAVSHIEWTQKDSRVSLVTAVFLAPEYNWTYKGDVSDT